jgi:acyl carrier protein
MKNKIFNIFKNFGIEPSAITDEAHFVKDLGLDSLDLVDLMMQLEQTFGIAIPDEDYAQITNMKALLAYLEQRQTVAV